MAKKLIQFSALLIAAMLIFSCNETTIIGSDLLDDEAVNVNFSDTFSITAYTIPGSRLQSNVNVNTFIAGKLDDPIFGKTDAEMYFNLDQVGSFSLEGTTLDSIVLTLEYDTAALYGNWKEADFDFSLHLGQEGLPSFSTDTFFLEEKINYDPSPIAQIIGKKIRPFDSVRVYDPNLDSLILMEPHFRLKVDQNISNTIFENLKTVTSDSEFDAFYPSFALLADPDRSASIAFDAGNAARNNGINALRIYYTIDSSQVKSEYEFLFDRSMTSAVHNYTGSPVEESIDNINVGNNQVYVQGLAGVRTVVDLSSLRSLENVLLNKVEVELTVAEDELYQTDIYTPIITYSGVYLLDGNLTRINDLLFAVNDPFIFEGILREVEENGNTLLKVNLNITNHAISLLDNKDISPELIISALSGVQSPARTVFYGPEHPTFPMKLNVAYTISQ